jgi:hypothetical protein
MQVTKVMKEKTVEIAKEQKANVLWVNKSGEFFTTENMASLSVKGKKEEYAKIDLTAKVTVPADVPENKDDENQK